MGWLVGDLDDLLAVFPSLPQMRRMLSHALDARLLHGLHLGMASLGFGGLTNIFRRIRKLQTIEFEGAGSAQRPFSITSKRHLQPRQRCASPPNLVHHALVALAYVISPSSVQDTSTCVRPSSVADRT